MGKAADVAKSIDRRWARLPTIVGCTLPRFRSPPQSPSMMVAAASGVGTLAAMRSGMRMVPTAAAVPAEEGMAELTIMAVSAAPRIRKGPARFKSLTKTARRCRWQPVRLMTEAKPMQATMTSKTFDCFIEEEKASMAASGSPARQASARPPEISTRRVSYFFRRP